MDITIAAKKGYYTEVKKFIDKGVKVDTKDKNGDTALILAALYGHTAIVSLLIEAGANVNLSNSRGARAVEKAIRGRHIDIIKYLIDHKTCFNMSCPEPLLIQLAQMDESDLVEHALLYERDVNIKNKYGQTALFFSVKNKNFKDIALLVSKGADASIKDNRNVSIYGSMDKTNDDDANDLHLINKVISDALIDKKNL